MARPRKPTVVKKLQGTLQPCRTNANEPVPQTPLARIAPPEHLSEIAKKAWVFALSQAPEELLTSLDFAVFEQWTVLYSQLVEIQKRLNQEGLFVVDELTGATKPNPLIRFEVMLQDTLRKYMTEMGFTPASRSKISVSKKTETKNEFLEL